MGHRGLRAPLTPHSIVLLAPPPCHGRLDARTVALARRWPPGGAPARSCRGRRSPSHPGRCSPHGTTPVARTPPRHGLPLAHASPLVDPRQPCWCFVTFSSWCPADLCGHATRRSRRCLRARLAPPGCTSRTLLWAYSRHTAFCFNSRGVALCSVSNTYLLQDQPETRGATRSAPMFLPRTPCSKSCCEHTCAATSSLPQFPLPLSAIRLCLAGLDPPFVPVHHLTTRAASVVGCLRQYLLGCDGQQSWEKLAGANGGLPSDVLLARRGEMVVSTWNAPESCMSSGCALRGGAAVGVQISSFVRQNTARARKISSIVARGGPLKTV